VTGRTKEQQRAWWAALSPGEREAYIAHIQARKAATPNAVALEASARLDIAIERGCFMTEVSDQDVAARLAGRRG
jgi:hypothetical protein